MTEINIPNNISFLDLKLRRDEKNKLVYEHEPLVKTCLANGMDPKFLKGIGIEIAEASLITSLYCKYLENNGDRNPLGDEIAEHTFNVLGMTKKQYKNIEYKIPSIREENNNSLLEAMADGNQFIQQIKTSDYQLLGMIFAVILLIEYKFDKLLIKFDTDIERKTFGNKIKVYEDFLEIYNAYEDEDVDFYKQIINPLKELNSLRNKIAHNIKKIHFKYRDIPKIARYVEENAPYLVDSSQILTCDDEGLKALGTVSIFGHKFSEVIANLRVQIK